MATAQLTLDFDTCKFYDGTGTIIQTFTGKNGSVREFQLTVTQGGVPLSFPEGATVKVAMKRTSNPAGTFLYETQATRVGWGSGTRWIFTLDLTDPAFASVVGTNVDFEVAMDFPDGQHIPSLTIPFAVTRNVI